MYTDGEMICGRDFRCPSMPLRPAGLGPMPQCSDIIELGQEVERRWLGNMMIDDDGPRPVSNTEMYAVIHWRGEARRDPDFVPHIAAMWGLINKGDERCREL